MPVFHYRAFDDDGTMRTGQIDATSHDAAIEVLQHQRLLAVDVSDRPLADRSQSWWNRELGASRLGARHLTLLTRELASLLTAKVPVDEALGLLVLQPQMSPRSRMLAERVLEAVRNGASLSQALESQDGQIPDYYWRIVRAGEESGALERAIEDLAAFLQRSLDARSRLVSALTYPATLLIASLLAIAVITTVLVPAMLPLFHDAGTDPPRFITWLAALHWVVTMHWLIWLTCLAALIGVLFKATRDEGLKRARARLALSVPVLGSLIVHRETARFTRTLGMLVRNGVPLQHALEVAGQSLTNAVFSEAVATAAREVREGGGLTAALASGPLFPDLAVRLISIGERTASLAPMLDRVANIYDGLIERQMLHITQLISPALTILIGIGVGGLILSVLSAIVGLNDLALR